MEAVVGSEGVDGVGERRQGAVGGVCGAGLALEVGIDVVVSGAGCYALAKVIIALNT